MTVAKRQRRALLYAVYATHGRSFFRHKSHAQQPKAQVGSDYGFGYLDQKTEVVLPNPISELSTCPWLKDLHQPRILSWNVNKE